MQEDLIENANLNNWGLYRNARLKMGSILQKEGKIKEAIDTFLEVCLLDVNGCFNCGTQDKNLLRKYPPFNPKLARVAPGVISDIVKLMKKDNLNKDYAKKRFIEVSKLFSKSIELPFTPEVSWTKLLKENRLFEKVSK